MTYNALNYFRQGDGALVLGGKLVDPSGAELEAPRFLTHDRIALVGLNSTSGGAIGAWQNPTGKSIVVTDAIILVTTSPASSVNIDIGTAVNGTTSGDDLFDGAGIADSFTGVLKNPDAVGTNGKSSVLLAAGAYITVTGAANSTGLAGQLLIPYIILD